jgi:hypothetical protein
MADGTGIKKIIARVVSEVLESQVPRLQDELVQRVLQEVEPKLGGGSEGSSTELLRAVSLIHAGTTQREILRALLDGSAQYCGRVALFVVKSGTATGWQGRGFGEGDAIKDFSFDVTSGLGARALQQRTVATGKASEVDSRFIEQFRNPVDDQAMVLPLMLKDKVAALVYADGGSAGKMDPVALELLAVSTSAWLEVASLRKQAPREGVPEAATGGEAAAAPVPVQTVSSFVDPFAGHKPHHVPPQPPPAEAASAPGSSVGQAEESPVVATSVAVAAVPTTNLPPEEAETHRKAQRFAKLLVDEIKLYNQAKVAEGRKHKDLYERLKEDLDKSRATYQRRYGNTAAASGDYFNSEVVRSLAGDDPSVMGANFRR